MTTGVISCKIILRNKPIQTLFHFSFDPVTDPDTRHWFWLKTRYSLTKQDITGPCGAPLDTTTGSVHMGLSFILPSHRGLAQISTQMVAWVNLIFEAPDNKSSISELSKWSGKPLLAATMWIHCQMVVGEYIFFLKNGIVGLKKLVRQWSKCQVYPGWQAAHPL